ncbi:MAG: hypothetical protein NTW74_12870, partial [Acidobacteria bacterium]|nr:hypothetical protein [Acidobacteriota bacterium]
MRFIVGQTLEGNGDDLQENIIGESVFGREPGYNPRVDSVVRIEAMNLRDNLLKYYEGSGVDDPILIEVAPGSYTPTFRSFAVAPKKEARSLNLKVPAAIAGFLLMLAGSAYWISKVDGSSFVIKPNGLFTDQKGNSRSPAFSPDGEWIAFSRDVDGVYSNIYLQPVDGGSARLFTFGDAIDHEPAWSADGKRIAFVRQRARGGFSLMVKDVGAQTSSETAIADLEARTALDWTKDGGAILAADKPTAASPFGIVRIEVRGGNKTQITEAPMDSAGDGDPKLSPDGRWLAFVRSQSSSVEDVFLMPASGGSPKQISSTQRRVGGLCWTPDSKALIISLEYQESKRGLWRYPLDGSPATMISKVDGAPISPTMPARGKGLAYVQKTVDTNLWGMDLAGKSEPLKLTSSIEMDSGPKLSPDGQRLAWRSASSGANELWVSGKDGSNPVMLTRLGGAVLGPAQWSSDASQLVFEARREGAYEILTIPSAGGKPKVLFSSDASTSAPS